MYLASDHLKHTHLSHTCIKPSIARMGFQYYWESFFSYFVAYLSLVHHPSSYAIRSNETDQFALLEIKAKIRADPLGIMNSWNSTTHFCKWYGVTCGQLHQRVIQLDLHSSQLTGYISPFIGNLSFLKILDLKNNSFIGPIPKEMGYLGRLQTLYLYNNSLSGEIPTSLSRCSQLIRLSLVNNHLVGEIPKELGSLLKLQFLSVSKNNLTGRIPPSLGNLSSLGVLSAEVNNLFGNIPDALGQLKQLTLLGLGLNQLSGTVPPSIFNLSSIRILDIGINQLQGNLPSDLFITLPILQALAVAQNQFTGSIPSSLCNASNIESLQFQTNNFIGKVPSVQKLNVLQQFLINKNSLGTQGAGDLDFLCSLNNATSLNILDISRNYIGGLLPECISNLSLKLTELSLYENYISGSIPDGIQNLISLQKIQVNNNTLSGVIPQTFGNLQKLVIMIFDQNNFSGAIPASLGNLSNLNRFHIAGNNLQGNIPASLGNCKYLQLLDLSQNNLSGSLPPEVIGLSSLSIYLSFSQNQLTGSLPVEISQLTDLGILDLSDNMLSGDIPSSLEGCTSLEYLYMKGNLFQGHIPPVLSSLRGIQVLDFSHNNLSGEIPEFLATFESLIYLDLSYNNFEGQVPMDGVFTNASATSVEGNSKLCGGIPEFHLPVCNPKRNKKKMSTKVKVAIVAASASGLTSIILLLSLPFLLKFRKKSPASTSSPPLYSHLQVSYQDLHRATNGFSSENLIGMGSFASVYKWILQEEGTPLAIKVLDLQHRGAAKSFIAECEALRNIKHRNLVKIVTACSSTDYQGNDFKALVYEFMPNGSLEDWLHPIDREGDDTETAKKNLTLLQRLNIALDVSNALEYLHYHCGTPIVHCDLKPSNVLLDNELIAHVSDFGIAKLLEKDIGDNSCTNHSSSIGVRGTIGYAAPEYGVASEVSVQGDVYSYGILLLEMLTGKRPTDDIFKEGLSLHQFAMMALPNEVMKIIDPILVIKAEGEFRNRNKILECLELLVGIGVACSAELPGDRMNIIEVTKKLTLIKEKLVKVQGMTGKKAIELTENQ